MSIRRDDKRSFQFFGIYSLRAVKQVFGTSINVDGS
jgi:hypothetical protein